MHGAVQNGIIILSMYTQNKVHTYTAHANTQACACTHTHTHTHTHTQRTAVTDTKKERSLIHYSQLNQIPLSLTRDNCSTSFNSEPPHL